MMRNYNPSLLVLSVPETSVLLFGYFIILFGVNAIFSGRLYFCFYVKSYTEKVCRLYLSCIYMSVYTFTSFKTLNFLHN